MEAFHDLVSRLVKSFDAAGLEYAFTGALAASFYGVPRTTVDVDIMVEVAAGESRDKLILALQRAGVEADGKRIADAFESGYGIATFRDGETPYSVDVIFSGSKLRKRGGTFAGLLTFFQAPEDLVLAKLRMIRATVPRGRAVKDEEDVKAILKFTEVDLEAVRRQARKDGTLALLETLTT